MVSVLLVGKGPPDRGGIAAQLETLLSSELASRHRVALLNLTRPAAVRQGGRLTATNVHSTLADAAAVWSTSRRYDVVSIHSALVPAVTALRAGVLAAAARARGCGVVIHAHGGQLRAWLRGRARRFALRAAVAPAHLVVAVARGEHAALATITSRVILVENGIDPAPFGVTSAAEGSARDVPRVLYVGLLTPRKGVVDLLEASEHLRTRGIRHELVLVGGTPDEGPDAEATVRAAASSTVVFAGPQPHAAMPAVYRDADVFCLPSWWEAMPLSILEAMASGLPVVATTVGEIPRMVEHGATGYLVPPRDPAALAAALEKLLADSRQRRRMGDAGRRRVAERFHLKGMVEELERRFLEVNPRQSRR